MTIDEIRAEYREEVSRVASSAFKRGASRGIFSERNAELALTAEPII